MIGSARPCVRPPGNVRRDRFCYVGIVLLGIKRLFCRELTLRAAGRATRELRGFRRAVGEDDVGAAILTSNPCAFGLDQLIQRPARHTQCLCNVSDGPFGVPVKFIGLFGGCCIHFHVSLLDYRQYTQRVSEFNFRRPARLRAGARIALIAPAGPVTPERITHSAERCSALGLVPIIGSSAHQRTGYLAGDDTARAHDVMWAFTDPEVDAVWALRGGYGSMRLASFLDFDLIARSQRPYIGFSDNTFMHLMLSTRSIVSFHAPHPGADFPPETEAAFLRVMFGEGAPGTLPLRSEDPAPRTLAAGGAMGRLIGGNLSMLAAACGTPAQMRAEGCIVFIEDIAEPAYRVDRCFTQLDLAGALQGVRGFAFGRFSELPEGCTEDEIVGVLTEVALRYNAPAVFNFPIGHVEHNWTIPVGVNAELDADACTLTLLEPAVS
jgi:muramoyltetrapeptide carboxypeptidase